MCTIAEIKIKNKELKGRLESGLYTFIGGHIYYGNNCIKMRYDLLKEHDPREDIKIQKLSEKLMFDEYPDIFMLKKGQKVLANSPINSTDYQKLIYFITSLKTKKMDATQVVMMPYPHQKRIYLNQMEPKT